MFTSQATVHLIVMVQLLFLPLSFL